MQKIRIAYVLTQPDFGPADVAVALTRWAAAQPDIEVKLFAPAPKKGLDQIRDHWVEIVVPGKGDLKAMTSARQKIADFKPDVIHAQDRRSGLLVLPFALRRRPSRPVVLLTYHGAPEGVSNEWAFADGKNRPSGYRAAVLAADAVVGRVLDATVVVAPDMRSFLVRRLHLPARRVHHIDNGLHLPARDRVVFPEQVRRLLFIGSLIERKGVSDLLEALVGVRKSRRDVTLSIAGDGPLADDLQEQVRATGLADAVEFLGFREDTQELLAQHDCLVLPSHLEQQPLVLIEAMGAGRAIVATAVGGVREMLPADNATTALVEPHDPTGLARAILAFTNIEEPADPCRATLDWVGDRFSIAVTGQKHVNLYRDLTR